MTFGWLTPPNSKNMLHNFYLPDTVEYSWIPKFKNTSLFREKYVQEALSLEQIAHEFKCSTQTIKKHLKTAGVPARPQTYLKVPKCKKMQDPKIISLNEIRVNQMILDYRRLGMSAQKIANIMNDMGIPRHVQGKVLALQDCP